MKFRICLLLLLIGLNIYRPDSGLAYEADACIDCHGLRSTQSRLRIDVQAFTRSVHADNADCTDCHSQVEDESHSGLAGSGAVNCTVCHDQQNRHGLGGAGDNRPDCFHCHTRHHILGKADVQSSIHPDQMEETCARCHPAQSGRVDYLSWLPSVKIATHPKADLSGNYEARNCVGCHQGRAVHGEEELISEETCHRCHLNAENRNPMLGVMHSEADAGRQTGVFAMAIVYQIVLSLLLAGGMVFFIRKFSGTQRR